MSFESGAQSPDAIQKPSEDQNYYERLGVPKNATLPKIKEAFRVRAQLFHPDKNKDEDKLAGKILMQLLTEAYEILKDSEKRTAYDTTLPEELIPSNLYQGFGHGDPNAWKNELFGPGHTRPDETF